MTKALHSPAARSTENATFSICLAEILGADVGEVPASSAGIGLDGIGYWLAAQNLALIPVRDPAEFQWAGWWIARLAGGDGYVVMAGTPSDVAWVPEGVTRGSQEVVEGWVVAAPALALPSRNAQRGTVEAIYRFADSGAPAEELQTARLISGVGIDGDRYALGKGHFSEEGRWGQALRLGSWLCRHPHLIKLDIFLSAQNLRINPNADCAFFHLDIDAINGNARLPFQKRTKCRRQPGLRPAH